ncbi:transcription factor SPT20 homolog, partial [Dendronephthya gigantea]|uniref:transcription factor SPT20 homolog n=1 Tax=Dendronephthya gigantea TaxID=151771 RepID=UPI00106D6453
MADKQASVEASFLQSKLGDLDIETLQKLLQTAIANKAKEPEPSGVVTPTLPITSTDVITPSPPSTISTDVVAPILPSTTLTNVVTPFPPSTTSIDVVTPTLPSTSLADEVVSTPPITTSTDVVTPTPPITTSTDVVTPTLPSTSLADEVVPTLPSTTSTDANQTVNNGMTEMNDEIESNKPIVAGSSEMPFNGGYDGNEQAQIMADEDFSPGKDFSQDTPPNDQEKGSYFVPTQVTNADQQAIGLPNSPNTPTVNLQALKIYEDDDAEELTSHVSEKKANFASTSSQSSTLVDTNQFADFVDQDGQGNYLEKTFLDDQQNAPLNQASTSQDPKNVPSQMYIQPKQTLFNTQWTTPSNTIGKLDQKPILVSAEQQTIQPSTNQFNLPLDRPLAGFDQEFQTAPSPMSISSSNSLEDVPSKDFPSVVPPLLIPISKVSQYLPDGTAILNTESRIPLALKPVIVLKNEVALMVFERDDGLCNGCEKVLEQQDLQDLKEKHTLKLRRSLVTYSKQQPPQLRQNNEPVEPLHQQSGSYVSEAKPRVQGQNNLQASHALSQQQLANDSGNLQGQQPQKHDQQASQQWHLADETLHQQQQQQQMQQQQQQQMQQQQQQQQMQ